MLASKINSFNLLNLILFYYYYYILIIITLSLSSANNNNNLVVQNLHHNNNNYYNKCPELLRKTIILRDNNSSSSNDRNGSRCAKNNNIIKCDVNLTEASCPPDTIYLENFALCGCCPVCARFIGINEGNCVQQSDPYHEDVIWYVVTNSLECEKGGNNNNCHYLSININQCYPGLSCEVNEEQDGGGSSSSDDDDTTTTTTTTTQKQPQFICKHPIHKPLKDQGECLYRKSLYRMSLHHWDPICEPDGTFSPKQCKGSYFSGECFCVNGKGERIFGREWRIRAENQTCECSRKVFNLRSKGLISTYHCTANGNFERLQCDTDTSLCYCVDPKSGQFLGPMVPEAQWKLLPCYSLNVTTNGSLDGKYLRKCESEYAGIKQLEIENKYHGVTVNMKNLDCDYDGSFSAVMQSTAIRFICVYKNGTGIGDYGRNTAIGTNCACARDVNEHYPSHERPLPRSCETWGNYYGVYDFGSYSSCVDPHGFLYGDVVPSMYICCLLNEGCSTEISEKCYGGGEVSGGGGGVVGGYKPCFMWVYRD